MNKIKLWFGLGIVLVLLFGLGLFQFTNLGKAFVSCTDTEDGEDIFVKGLVTGVNDEGVTLRAEDVCGKGTVRVLEFFCSEGQISQREHICPKGYVCADGKCVS
jgi:hypothetical protein